MQGVGSGWNELLADEGITKDNVGKFIISEPNVTRTRVRTCENFKIVLVQGGTSGNFRQLVTFLLLTFVIICIE